MAKSATVTILLGSARSRKAATVRGRYLDLVRQSPPTQASQHVLMLVPTARRRQATIDALLRESDAGILVQPNVWTFPQYAEWALGRLGTPVRRITELQRRGLLADALAWCLKQKQITYLVPIADRPGLLDSLGDFVQRVKTEEIRPEQIVRAARKRGLSHDLAAVYARYQKRFEAAGLYDDAGLFWQAREALASAGDAFDWPTHVLVDGFQDFSKPQRDILRTLHDHGARLLVTLPCRRDRPEVFGPTLRTLENLQATFGDCVDLQETASQSPPSLLATVQERLFDDSAATPSDNAAAAVTFAETAGRVREIEYLARRIKQMLVAAEGTTSDLQPADVAVILPSRQPYEELIQQVFPQFGLPITGLSGTPLSRLPLTRWLLELVRLPLNEFSYASLAAVLRSPYFPCELLATDGRTLEAAGRMLHQAGAYEGLADHVRAIRGYGRDVRANGLHDAATDDEVATEAGLADDVAGLLERLGARLAALPQRAPRRDHLAALAALVTDCRFKATLAEVADLELVARDLASLDALDALLAEMSGLDDYVPAGSLTASEFAAELQEAFLAARVAPPRRSGGAVNILDIRSSRALTFRVVAMPGLTEGTWPQPLRADLADSAESRGVLADAGLAPADRRAHLAEQRFLFYMAATRASERLIVTRPASDEDGRPLCAGPFWTALLQAAFGDREPVIDRVTARDCDLPADEAAGGEALRRVAMVAVASGTDDDLPLVAAAEAMDSTLRPTLQSVAAIRERESPRPFGRFDGVLADQGTLAALAAAYPAERPLSITSLEHFVQCPFWFFAETVCRLRELEAPEETLLDDQAGLLYHDILCDFYRRRSRDRKAGTRLNRVPPERLREEMSQAVERVFAQHDGGDRQGLPALRAIQKEDIRERLLAYVEAEAARCADLPCDLEPLLFEWSFGMPVRGDESQSSTESPAVVDSAYGPIRLRGRVDRIDRAADAGTGETWLELVDYKSGSQPSGLGARLREGAILQLPLYLLAVRQHLSATLGAPAARAAYYYLRDLKYNAALALTGDKADDGQEVVEQAVRRVIETISACRCGKFPPVPSGDCPSYCPYDRLCRTARWRVDLKTRGLAP
ncbi:MAG: exodeoxyribonuclease V subunit gamma [Planctomycetes bacterium]|nr:exodeoxyribonuclease V subunit gamma [Planctomycetota bacterium]